MKRKRSAELYDSSRQILVGGVNSPVRAFGSVGGTPVFFERGEGACLWDVDGGKYIDYVCSWGPMILGHAEPGVISAIKEAAARGTSFGAPTEIEEKLARLVVDFIPSVEMVRFVNSGTEAAMSALRLARGFTGRDKVIKFRGCYHGHADSLLIKAGSGGLTFSLPDSSGVTEGAARDTLLATYNDLSSVESLVGENEERIAAIVVEPVAANMGVIPPDDGFLQGLRDICGKNGIMLIFDEVITGFRVSRGGAQELYNVMPDITILGKVIGGGMPVGAYGARHEIMEKVSPLGPVYQAGTLSGNPVAMAAGYATLSSLSPQLYTQLERSSSALEEGLLAGARESDVGVTINRVGSLLTVFFTDGSITDLNAVEKSDMPKYSRLFQAMLDSGVYLPPSGYEAWFISYAHTESDIDHTVAAFTSACRGLVS